MFYISYEYGYGMEDPMGECGTWENKYYENKEEAETIAERLRDTHDCLWKFEVQEVPNFEDER